MQLARRDSSSNPRGEQALRVLRVLAAERTGRPPARSPIANGCFPTPDIPELLLPIPACLPEREVQYCLQLASHGPVMREARFVAPQFRAAVRPIALELIKASTQGSAAALDEPVRSLLGVVSLLLPTPAAIEGTLTATLKRHISRAVEGQAHELMQAAGFAVPPPPSADELEAAARRALAQLKAGNLSQAARCFDGTSIADPEDPAVRQALRELHPPPAGDAPMPPMPPGIVPYQVSEPALKQLIRRLPRGKGVGPDGMTFEHIRELAKDPDIFKAFHCLVNDVLAGRLSGLARALLLSSRLIGLRQRGKPKIRPIAIGNAIIRLAERALVKWALGIPKLKEILQPAQLGIAVNCGVEAAVHSFEFLLHRSETPSFWLCIDFRNAFNELERPALLTALSAVPELSPLLPYAFWAYSQPTVLLVPNRAGKIVDVIASARGVQQGRPFALLAFCIAAASVYKCVDSSLRQPLVQPEQVADEEREQDQHPAEEKKEDDPAAVSSQETELMTQTPPNSPQRMEAKAAALESPPASPASALVPAAAPGLGLGLVMPPQPQQPATSCVAVVDDNSYHDPNPAKIVAAYERCEEEAKKLGLTVEGRKSHVLCPPGFEPPEPLRRLSADKGVSIVTGAVRVLGAAIGPDPAARQELLLELSSQQRALLEACKRHDLLSNQAALALIRCCLAPSLSYLLRVTPPSRMKPLARQHDELVRGAVARRLGIISELPEDAVTQLHLPVREGGLGIPSAEAISRFAWFSSVASSAKYILQVAPMTEAEERDSQHPFLTELRHVLADIRALLGNAISDALTSRLPPPGDAAILHYYAGNEQKAYKLQHLLCKTYYKALGIQMRLKAQEQKDNPTLARLHAVTAPKSGLVFTTLPVSKALKVPDDAYQFAACMRLGLVRSAYPLPAACTLCGEDMQLDPLHYLSCRFLKEEVRALRHDPLCLALKNWSARLGGYCVLEPRNREVPGSKRYDGRVVIGRKRLAFDVSIIHPLAKSHLQEAAKGPLGAAKKRETEKENKHQPQQQGQQQGARNGVDFYPFVLESYGGLGDKAARFLKELLDASRQVHHVWDPQGRLALTIWRELAVTLAIGNNAVVQAGLNKVPHYD